MKHPISNRKNPVLLVFFLLTVLLTAGLHGYGQSCPATTTVTINSYPNTYYPGAQATVNSGSTSIAIGAATYGSTPIGVGDILLIIQMQGAQITSTNNINYGNGSSGSGYLVNAQLLAGNMEYVVATNAIPLSGGTLTLQSATVNSYKLAAFGTYGQYTYQVIRVPAYYNLLLGANITPPAWDGATGGVVVLEVVDTLYINGKTINASGTGFRGGGGALVHGGSDGGTDYRSTSPTNANLAANIGDHASKGEGIAGTPRLINSNNYGSLVTNTAEGYPNGSYAMGAPGNAGGGGTDNQPASQNDNAGGGGGSNGGKGGKGGNSYSTNQTTGGNAGAAFAQSSVSRLVMGGGGGAGDNNDNTGNLGAFSSSGASGGGIVIVNAYSIGGSGVINVSGMPGDSSIHNDGAGGGGAGGSVLIHASYGLSNVKVYANGGNGGISDGAYGTLHYAHGPGGGGGGGVIYSNSTLNAASSSNGGLSGRTRDDVLGITNYGAAAGSAGILNMAATIPQPLSCALLPMEFLSVAGVVASGHIALSWQVANERTVQTYFISRSSNAVDYSTAGSVAYKPGDGGSSQYNFVDLPAGGEGMLYYRIEAEDMDGHITFSPVILIKAAPSKAELSISPDPAVGLATITWFSAGTGNAIISVIDASGRIMLNKQYPVKAGINKLSLTNLEALPNGLYIVEGHNETNCMTGKLLIHH